MISNAPENNSSAVSFMRLKLKRECKEDDVEMGESKGGLDCRRVKIVCSLEGGHKIVCSLEAPLEGGA